MVIEKNKFVFLSLENWLHELYKFFFSIEGYNSNLFFSSQLNLFHISENFRGRIRLFTKPPL